LFTVNDTWSTAVTGPYVFDRSCTSINALLQIKGDQQDCRTPPSEPLY
jgi:hypothetical protein